MKLHPLGKVNPVAHPDLLAGADNKPPLEWPKIDQNTKAIALEFSIWSASQIAPPSTTWKGESSGDTFLSRSARRI